MVFRKIICFSVLFCSVLIFIHADSYSGSSAEEALIIRVPLWVFLEPQPGLMEHDSPVTKMPPRKALTDLAADILGGMTYGWIFSYTPFDKKRDVAEEFLLAPIGSLAPDDKRLHITDLRPQYPYLYCWAEYHIDDAMAIRKKTWKQNNHITAKGYGSGNRKEEIDGIRTAYRAAALNAVRRYLQKTEKNKPKCVSGEILIKDNPRLYAANGKFNVELTVYLYIKEIIPYTVF